MTPKERAAEPSEAMIEAIKSAWKEWQPIETAPLNTTVLIWDGDMMWVAKAEFRRIPATWHWETPEGFVTPTHWMPLPEPPKDTRE